MPEACSLHGADRGTSNSAFHLHCRYHKEGQDGERKLRHGVFVSGVWMSRNRVLEDKCLGLESGPLEQGLDARHLGQQARHLTQETGSLDLRTQCLGL